MVVSPARTRSLASDHPRVAAQWHPTRNLPLAPDQVTRGSGRRAWWLCDQGHEWQAVIYSRTIGGNGCPYCAGKKVHADNSLARLQPEIAATWHPIKNGDLTPADVTCGSKARVWWFCDSGHEWAAPVCERTTGKGCPCCAHRQISADNNLASLRPDLAAQWHPSRNRTLTPRDVFPAGAQKVWWQCDAGHAWQASVNSRSNLGTGCPFCSGRRVTRERSLAALRSTIAMEWHPSRNGTITPDQVSVHSKRTAWWMCAAGHEWEASVRSRVRARKARSCPICAKESRP